MRFNARIKVILGFFLATCLIVGAGVITYYSVTQLLDSVESLAEPNQKLRNLNELLADIYQLDKSRSVFVEEDSSQDLNFYNRIQEEIKKLERMAADTAELGQLKRINYSVNELMVVYKGLDDVKSNLYNRNFSKEALNNIERKIKRKEELSRLQSLGKIRIGINPPSNDNNARAEIKPTQPSSQESLGNVLAGAGKEDMEKILGMLRLNLNRVNPVDTHTLSSSDSIIYAVRQMVLDINNEEQYLRSRLSALEQELNEKNRNLIINIQEIVAALQHEALQKSKAENNSAYQLTYKLSLLLGLLIIIGVIGSSGFIFSIIKEIKKSESYQKTLAEAKKKSDNLAKTKQNFLASMSHEIRNPLHVIKGYNDAIAKTSLDADQREYVRMIQLASGTLLGIVNDILDFSKLEAGKIKIQKGIINPELFFKNLHSFYKQKAQEKGLKLDFSVLLPENKFLLGDDLRINQIMNNLLSNAVKFTEEGKVLVRVYFEQHGPEEKGTLVLQVKDTGMGMTADLQRNLFKEFNQGDGSVSRRFGGTGLGMAIIKRLVDLQNGQIKVDSEHGKGTEITVCLPSTLLKKKEKQTLPASRIERMEGLQILLIDDDKMGLKFVELMLNKLGATIVTYSGGIDFKKNFKEEFFDLVLLDIQMPEIDGYQVFELLRENPKYREVPILAMTANVFANEKENLIKFGFDGLLLKPFNENDLIEKISSSVKLVNTGTSPEHSAESREIIPEERKPGVYDLSEIRKFCMGDEALLKEILEGFYTQTGLDLIRINKAVDEGDYEKVQGIAHQLSSRLGQLKFKERSLAKAIECDLKEGKTEGVKEKVWALTEKINGLLEDLGERYGYAFAD
ncbi:His Kinase A (phospho-acceptor) domain-containing protein [Cyclobacterium lianum]|uniref:histidine kinase n=1 Tax=Cyclobacterium lianum TaxID=388280 RepID=A0A1M7Q8X0_9BACT|nr:ATP-binding protein [Cyclobacterium lianum]SHN27086.1 His Kinase A (phospho-acceptor) domain-containing protein [Cyclobacterium lianum]